MGVFENILLCQISAAATAKWLQSCPTLCDPIDCSPSGSPIPGILQARTLEWVAISFSNAWKWKVKVKLLSRVRLLVTPWTAAHQAPPSMGFFSKSAGVGCHCLLHKSPLLWPKFFGQEWQLLTLKFTNTYFVSLSHHSFTHKSDSQFHCLYFF